MRGKHQQQLVLEKSGEPKFAGNIVSLEPRSIQLEKRFLQGPLKWNFFVMGT